MNIINFLYALRSAHRRLHAKRDRLYRMAYAWSSNSGLADDLTRETLTRALKKIHQPRADENLETLLYGILHALWHEHLRSHPHTGAPLPGPLAQGTREHHPQPGNTLESVRHAVQRLPLNQREVVTLVDLGGLSYAEVAEIVGIASASVVNLLGQARKNLHDLISGIHTGDPPGVFTLSRPLRSA